MTSFVIQINLNLAAKLKQGLQEQDFVLSQPNYTLFQGKKPGVTCTLYTSGKLMVQGKNQADFIQFYLEPEILKTFSYGYEEQDIDLRPHIGIDESGKGDFFGPLCIAGVYADETSIPKLSKLGVKDSKKLNDPLILKIAQKIRKEYLYHIVRIGPERYNELYEKFGNLNLLLGWGHATAIENLIDQSGCERVIIDQFAAEHVVENALKRKKKKALLTQRTKAEEDLVVAAASILARAAFLEGLVQLEKKWEIQLPKGASQKTILAGKKFVSQNSSALLGSVAKLHFKTSQVVLDI
ncbi:MAG: Ribonuclease HIII [Chlamydiales bacterium]|nr:Ribonuclease HIII [Chlamydiales bacterium]